MAEYLFDDADLEKMFSEIEVLLFESEIYEIKYEDKKNTELKYAKNRLCYTRDNKPFIRAIKGEPALYCIWQKKAETEKFVPVYVGHAQKPVDRMRNHLSKKDDGTGSCLEEVQRAVGNGDDIGVTFVKIKPPYMRTAVEEWLIGKRNLSWNIRGVRSTG